MSEHVLDELFQTIQSRKGADPASSHTAAVLAKGPAHAAKKMGEEAVEAVIEGVRGDKAALAAESADLLYHLLVLWAASGIEPASVWEALEKRRGTSGIAEKASRPKD
jgi:phosphoribosyl-ATP pyrophosphohydrolase